MALSELAQPYQVFKREFTSLSNSYLLDRTTCDLYKGTGITMAIQTIPNSFDLQTYLAKLSLGLYARRIRKHGVNWFAACTILVFAATASAQETKSKITLVPGSEVNLDAVMKADWVQGEGPTSFEPGKIYVFECWATWCPPCVALIPHVNELHKKYYDKGLRVHGMNTWEDDREKVVNYVKSKGEGMSYPVAYTNKSAFETEWLKAAGVKSIPHAFVVRNGKLLLATEAVRLTDSLIELMLSGDEGAEQAAAKIKAAYDAREKTDKLSSEIYSAKRAKDADKLATKISEVEKLDPDHPNLPVWNLELLMVRKDWPAALKSLNGMPKSSSKNTFLAATSTTIVRSEADAYPIDFTKAFTPAYAQYIKDGAERIGPNHLAKLTILYWRIGDKENAIVSAEKGLQAAINHKTGKSEFRTIAFKRFVKSVKDGTLPEFSDLSAWHISAREEAKKAAAAKEDSSEEKE